MKRKIIIFIGWLGLSLMAFGQETDQNQILVEDAVENIGEEGSFDFNTLFEELVFYRENPLNLNTATEGELTALHLLTPLQIASILNYRATQGAFISVYELQAVPNLELVDIRRILPFIEIKDPVISEKRLSNQLKNGTSELFLRYRRTLETAQGYHRAEENQGFLGSPDYAYLRYRYHYYNELSFGVTMEKDEGEPFFQQKNRNGFDFYSAHFFIKNGTKPLKTLALGDFEVRFGQGLIMWSGFGFGKSAFVLNSKQNAPVLRPYTSVNENLFLRGGAATLNLRKNLEFTAFTSFTPQDANLKIDTLAEDPLTVSSLQIIGLHRTESEFQDKNVITNWTTGGQLAYRYRQGRIALNTAFTQLSTPLVRSRTLYNQFRFSGRQLANFSTSYDFTLKHFHFFGETALSDNGKWATLNGVLAAIGKTVDFTVLQRFFDKAYHTIWGTTFSESSGVNDEEGVYIGVQIRPNRRWQLAAYVDFWKHNWLRFNVNAPSKGQEYLAQINYQPNRKTLVYLRFRIENKEKNALNNEENFNDLLLQQKRQVRLHLRAMPHEGLQLTSRMEWLRFYNGTGGVSDGFMVYQDIAYRHKALSFSARFALFNTDDYNSRIYAFENDLLYHFSIPAYYNKGQRFYLNLKYKMTRTLQLEFRISQTKFFNQETIGSGLNLIEGNTRTTLKGQIRLRF